MRKRILSLALALVMLLLAVPVTALSVLATEVADPSEGRLTTSFLDYRPDIVTSVGDNTQGSFEEVTYKGGWDYVTYKMVKGEMTNPRALTHRYVVTVGGEKWLLPAGETSQSTCGAVYVFNNTSEASLKKTWQSYGMSINYDSVVGTRYTAEQDGSIEVSFDRVMNAYIESSLHKNVLEYAIYVNGQKVWPANNTGAWLAVSYYGADIPDAAKTSDTNRIAAIGEDLSAVFNESMPDALAVEKGQTVEFLVRSVSFESYSTDTGAFTEAVLRVNNSRASYVDGTVAYVDASGSGSGSGSGSDSSDTQTKDPYTTAFLDNRPATTGEHAYFGGWDYITYQNGIKMQNPRPLVNLFVDTYNQRFLYPAGETTYARNGTVFLYNAPSEASKQKGWQAYGMALPKEAAIGTRYTAADSGRIKVSFGRVLCSYIDDVNYKSVLEYAIYVNGQKVWPQNNTGDWYRASFYGADIPDAVKTADKYYAPWGEDLAETLNASMPGEITVSKGQTVEFLVRGISQETYNASTNTFTDIGTFYSNHCRSNYVDGVVTYTKIAEAEPTVEVGVRVDGALSICGQVKDYTAGGEYGVYLNGEKVMLDADEKPQFELKVPLTKADEVQTVQLYYFVSGEEMRGELQEITLGGLLREYASGTDADVAAAANATLAYIEAACVYFQKDADPINYAAPEGKADYIEKGKSIGKVGYEGADEVRFRGISLLLNDLVNIKIVTEGALPEGASLQIATDLAFEACMTVTDGEITEDGTGTKFIMEGISAKNWNTDYYIRVVDVNGKVISDTLSYSVAAYYGRMIESDAATYKLKALISHLMALCEAIAD